ncbi:putative senescence regulator S40 [Helianthus annuus]|nr:putative senescence regulator S40 [Helianthus annuus]KAJ0745811.1 putative senescence regulator S40 [Helianthus annuus]KAJ0917181.1 putative senescence regulator S40 [Helianthus annuus]
MADWHEKSSTEGEEDFQEKDVWGDVMEGEESNTKVKKANKMKKRSSCVWTSHSHDGARMCDEGHRQQQSSAPMGIPDRGPRDRCYEDDDGDMVPPHEYIARRLATSSISMCEEGVRRTLKGRDLNKLRNAIWTKTGFLE